jgi:site-specific DNA-methyltransferase (adenine-specific)
MMGTVTLHHGDALDVLRTLESDSIHALVCDPPSGIAFMNMAWDDDRGGRAQWVAWLTEIMSEVHRVCAAAHYRGAG